MTVPGPSRKPARIAFTGERCRDGYRLTKFFVGMTDPARRAAFRADETAVLAAADLSEAERDLVRRRDYLGMLEHGAAIYAIAKASEALGTTLVGIGAQMRGETMDEFMRSRPFVRMRAQGAPAGGSR